MRFFDYIRKWIGWFILLAAIMAVAWWGWKYSRQTTVVRLAAGAKGGYYNQFCTILKYHIEKNTDLTIHILETRGAVENRRRLLNGEADIGLVQNGPLSIEKLALVVPLWNDYIQVIVPKNSPVKHFVELAGKNVTIGKVGSGIRANAEYILEHYGIEPESLGKRTHHYKQMIRDNTIAASMVTTSLLNPSVQAIMATGEFTLLPLEEAEGVVFRRPYLSAKMVPPGVFTAKGKPVPEKPVKTVCALSMLVARKNTPSEIIAKILPVLYSLDLRIEAPVLLDMESVKKEAAWNLLNVHPASISFFNPYQGAQRLSDYLNTLFDFMWLIIPVFVIVFVVLAKLKNRKKEMEKRVFETESRSLKGYMSEIARIEEAQRSARDMRVLKRYLDEAIFVKKQAMNNVGIHARNSFMFLAFLEQTGFVVREIEWKLGGDENRPGKY